MAVGNELPTVSIIIPCYNSPDLLRVLLEELRGQSYPHRLLEVVVVDDGSRNPIDAVVLAPRAKMSDFASIRMVRHSNNRGRAAARNSGVRASTGELLVFTDVDGVPDAGFVEMLVLCLERSGGGAARANMRVHPDLCRRSAFLRYRDSRYLGGRSSADRRAIHLEDLAPQFFATGGAAVKRADFMAVGMFDEEFTRYGGEDEELAVRLSAAGVRIVYCSDARIWDCDHSATLTDICRKYEEYGRWSAPWLFAKWPNYRDQSSAAKLEPLDFSKDPWSLIARKVLLRLVLSFWVADCVRRLLSRIDGWKLMVDPPSWAYQFVLAAFLKKGVRLREAGVEEGRT